MQGLIRSDGSGLATFNVQYSCICMRLWPEEVVDAEVEQVTSYGIRCKVGPFRIFVSEKVRSRATVSDAMIFCHDVALLVWLADQKLPGCYGSMHSSCLPASCGGSVTPSQSIGGVLQRE
jgi:hypothetical protein